MPEPLKNLYTKELIKSLCRALKSAYSKFDSQLFCEDIFDDYWKNKELKERMRHISETLHKYLPADYLEAITILKSVSQKFTGFEYMFFPDYVELYGLDEYDMSISALEHFTPNASSEFAVRPFIKKYKIKMMVIMEKWAVSGNHHVRRLASEGCRPRLPWAMALPEFKKDPQPVLKILENLKNDDSEFVRRSVANNLNDISKDNPQIVIAITKNWLGNNSNTDRLVKHACRTLLKKGDPEILELFGFTKPDHISVSDFKVQKNVEMGADLEFSFTLQTESEKLGKLRVEYVIDFMKNNGKRSGKVFKISESENAGNKKEVLKQHSFKKITTRKYYSGIHGIAVIINGKELKREEFRLSELN